MVIEDARMDVCGLTETKWKGTCVREWDYGMGVCARVDEMRMRKQRKV